MVALAVTLLSPLLLYLIFRAAIVGLSSAAAVSLPPKDATAALRQVLPAIADPRVKVPGQVLELARQSASASPLAYEPLIVFGRKAADEGDIKRAIAITEEARRRRPNYLLTRLLLMSYYGSSARYADAIREMDYLLRSDENVRMGVLPEVMKALGTHRGRVAVADVLAKDPAWRKDFAAIAQARGSIGAPEARELLELLRAKNPRGDWSLERGLYIDALVRAGEAREARNAWLAGLPEADRAQFAQIFDPDFTGRAAAPPFGWRFFDTAAGRAEIVRREGRSSALEVNYFGGSTVVVAEQMLALPAGTHGLSFNARSEGGIRAGQLFWSVTCIPSDQEVARVRVANPQAAFRRIQGSVQIPAGGCAGQRLRLTAEPGDVASDFTVQIAQLRIGK